jgi:uncharacterized protein (TIGR04222 family)
MDIFDLKGPEFLQLYLMALGIAVAVSFLWRRAMMGLFLGPAQPSQLDPFDAAYLAGGKAGLGNAVLASLVHREMATFTGDRKIAVKGGDAPDLHPIERQILGGVLPNKRYSLKEFRNLVEDDDIGQKLESKGLVPTPGQHQNALALPVTLMAIVLITGLIKIGIGVSRDKPVGFLIALSVLTGVLLILSCRPGHRTWQGSSTLSAMREANASLQSNASISLTTLAAADVTLALALWGPSMLTGLRLTPLHDMLIASGGSVGSSCGSGGGCGGGGCGGGGCGGCGGG